MTSKQMDNCGAFLDFPSMQALMLILFIFFERENGNVLVFIPL